MLRFIALTKAVSGKLFKGFIHSRLLAELPGADDLFERESFMVTSLTTVIEVQTGHPSDDPRMGSGPSMVGVL